jgi:acetoin utilization deacetylase AcuC-like enzyme
VKAFSADRLILPLPAGHRFPAEKYVRLRQRIESSPEFAGVDLRVPEAASEAQLVLVHTPEYVGAVLSGTLTDRQVRRIGLPWSPELAERSRRSVGGTLAACEAALVDGRAIHLGGGTHHAFPDHGAGYCVFNDVAVAVRHLQQQDLAARILILDLDVHQGDGTAAIFAGDPSVYTCSLHGEGNFPFHKQIGDLDLPFPSGTQDALYLETLAGILPRVLDASRPDLVVYLAGADPFEEDTLGRLSLTKEGLRQRDRHVLEGCCSGGLPVAIVLGGGYARNIEDTVDIHVNTLRQALAT